MLRYRPRSRHPDKSASADATDLMVDVETPEGETLAIDNPALIDMLRREIDFKHQLTLMHSESAMTDRSPLSIFSLQTVRKLGEETDAQWDKRRFRANIYLDLASSDGFAEDELVGRSVRIGADAIISIVQRDPRCVVITLDPDTAAIAPALLKKVAQATAAWLASMARCSLKAQCRKAIWWN